MTYRNAQELYRASLAEWSGVTFLLPEDAPLPELERDDWWKLHPHEVAVFRIDLATFPKLIEAYSWYMGAIMEVWHNDYWDFREEESRRWAHLIPPRKSEGVIDRRSLVLFMQEVTGLPLRQCDAMSNRLDAMELRSSTTWYADEVELVPKDAPEARASHAVDHKDEKP